MHRHAAQRPRHRARPVLPGVQRDVKDATAPSFRPRSSYARSIRALVAAATEHARSAAEYLEIA